MENEDFDMTIVFTPAMMGYKKKSDELISNNNISKWWKQSKTKLMNDFKNKMKEWYLAENDDSPYRWAEIHFTILRTNNKKIDSDALSSSTYKWTIDLLTELGYLVDDDQCRIILHPTKLNCEGPIETSVKMQVKFYERIEMELDELKQKVIELAKELSKVDGENHNKSASARVRKMLVEIKNGTPSLRRKLLDLDKG